MPSKQDRYFKVRCPECGTPQVFDKRKECRDDDVQIVLSKGQVVNSIVFVECQKKECRHRFKLEIDCTGYSLT